MSLPRPSRSNRRVMARSVTGIAACLLTTQSHAFDRRFDVCTFYESPEFSENHFRQGHFDRINWASPNGHQVMMGTDQRRSQLTGAGNVLGVYHNSLTQVYTDSGHDPVVAADMFRQYAVNNHNNTGPVPTWISLNEISSSLWQNSAPYREWLKATVARLHDHYGHEVIVFAPFAAPANPARAPDWQAIAAKAYIGVENFLSGEEVKNSGFSVTWAQAQYQASIDAYGDKGVDPSRLFLTEYFAHTPAGTNWGRAGIPIEEWVQVINIRSDAIRNVGFGGFVGYAWSNNKMGASDAEMYAAIEAYRSHIVVESEGPQWKNDASGTWSSGANWLSPFAPVPPNGVGQVANFVKPLTAPRTVSLDGAVTVGRMTFGSGASYTLAPGGGGTITLSNNGLAGSITVTSGAHTIATPLTLADGVNLRIAAIGLSISGALNNAAGKTITKTGVGQLLIGGPQTHGPGAVLNANAGVTTLASDGGQNLNLNARSKVNLNASQRLAALAISSGVDVTLMRGGARTLSVSSLSNSGTLDLADNDLIVRNGGAAALGSWNGSAYTGVTGQVQAGRNGGEWNAPGIVTREPAAEEGLTTLGVAPASVVLHIAGAQTATWNGLSVGAGDVLVMYTYTGDANLDGFISADDYSALDFAAELPSARGYFNGDFNYDGFISADDYSAIDFNLVAQGASLASGGGGGMSAVPEPALTAVTLLAGATFGAGRRRRHHRS